MVRRTLQPHLPDMHAVRIEIGESLYKAGGQILVQKEFHFAITLMWLSRSAA